MLIEIIEIPIVVFLTKHICYRSSLASFIFLQQFSI